MHELDSLLSWRMRLFHRLEESSRQMLLGYPELTNSIESGPKNVLVLDMLFKLQNFEKIADQVVQVSFAMLKLSRT